MNYKIANTLRISGDPEVLRQIVELMDNGESG
jgi:hypothetical protein